MTTDVKLVHNLIQLYGINQINVIRFYGQPKVKTGVHPLYGVGALQG